MPELPDIEVYRRYLDATSLHQRIERVHVESPALLKGTTPQGLGRAVHAKTLETTHRHGKYLFAGLSGGRWLVLHFGMSGELRYFGGGEEQSPDYTRCLVTFDNGFNLAYVAPRKLGLIDLVDSPQSLVEERTLGPDALDLDQQAFRELAGGRRGTVKSWIMDQHSIAGIGNIYSDEILFQAKLYPRRPVADLDEAAVMRLYDAMRRVLERAVKAGADPRRMPADFLLPHREAGSRCPKCGSPVKSMQAAGRTAWYCPRCQAA